MKLTNEQINIAMHGDSPAIVIAGAGSGKTYTICARVATLILSGENPESIAMLTFTKAAAKEMSNRIKQRIPEETANKITTGNFHSVGVNLLRKTGCTAEILSPSDVADNIDICRGQMREDYHNKTMNLPSASKVGAIISDMKNRKLDLAHTLELPDYESIDDEQIQYIPELIKRFNKRKDENNQMTYDDIITSFQELTVTHPQLFQHWKHLIIDEAQDMNLPQHDLIHAIYNVMEGNDIMLVGDAAQSIYGWRGASVNSFQEFPNKYPNCATYLLSTNFRSYDGILSIANEILKDSDIKLSANLHAHRGYGGSICLHEVTNEWQQRDLITDIIKQSYKKQDVAVLARSSNSLRLIEPELLKAGINYIYRGGHKFEELTEIRDALAIMTFATGTTSEANLMRLLKKYDKVGSQIAANILKDNKSSNVLDCLLDNRYYYNNSQTAAIVVRACQNLYAIATIIQKTPWVDMVAEIRQIYLQLIQTESMKPIQKLKKTETQEKRIETLNERIDHARTNLQILELMSTQSKSARAFLDDFHIETPIPESDEPIKVTLSTIHSAKGLEWEHVIITDATDSNFPGYAHDTRSQQSIHDEMEEQRRCLYVATTRARDDLDIVYPKTKGTYNNKSKQKLSRYLKNIEKLPEVIPIEHPYNRKRW